MRGVSPQGKTYRRIGVSAFAKHRQLVEKLLVIIAVPKSSLTSPDAHTPTRRPASPAVYRGTEHPAEEQRPWQLAKIL